MHQNSPGRFTLREPAGRVASVTPASMTGCGAAAANRRWPTRSSFQERSGARCRSSCSLRKISTHRLGHTIGFYRTVWPLRDFDEIFQDTLTTIGQRGASGPGIASGGLATASAWQRQQPFTIELCSRGLNNAQADDGTRSNTNANDCRCHAARRLFGRAHRPGCRADASARGELHVRSVRLGEGPDWCGRRHLHVYIRSLRRPVTRAGAEPP